MTWVTILNADIDPESPITTGLMTALRDNVSAVAAGDAGAPSIVQAAIGAAAVGQAEISTALQQSSASLGVSTNIFIVYTGGAYCLAPAFALGLGDAHGFILTYSANAYTWGMGARNSNSTAETYYFQQRYIQASPPYNLGDGDIPLFVFVLVDNDSGLAKSVSVAPEAPWHHNGPTSIIADRKNLISGQQWRSVPEIEAELNALNITRNESINDGLYTREQLADRYATDPIVEMEITQTIKQADMAIVPHSFLGNSLTGKTVVMLDPVSPVTLKLFDLYNQGEDIADLLINNRISFGNVALERTTPAGVIAVDVSF